MKENNDIELDQSFRDSVATIDEKGQRRYIHPKKPKGRLYNARTYTSIIYLIIFFGLPFIKIGGEPFFMLNVLDRKFIFFGQIFGPQDFFIFALGMITFMMFVILFTVIFGRVFCGWACPQTIFMEMVFRKIEYWIDGDMAQQRKLKEMPWNGEKIRKRLTKIVVFYAISFLIANFFMAYLIGMDQVKLYIHEGITAHFGTFATLLVFSGIFFFVYYWFREQVCIVVCPYGRLQGVLLDKNSIVVAYDYVRGEPRTKPKKHVNLEKAGDCIDCAACVRVCPTGIDIRNGTQLECVNCTACIDACDAIMDSVQKPRGLIRFASEKNIREGAKTKVTSREIAYSAVLALLLSVLAILLITRDDVDVTVLRASGAVYQTLQDGRLGNVYNIKMANKVRKEKIVTLKLENIEGEIQVVGDTLKVEGEGYKTQPFIIKIKPEYIKQRKTPIEIGVYEGNKKIKTAKTTFMGPAN
ncbi:MAG TPA: cytochrome c oxidase accessory protein CcoG [Chitinophagaceae bacterium]|nr:cytochrome c oxidase accessory protein CcoG [Chitinophagaceae bacterium]